MTKKRFTIEIDDENFAQILDNNVPIGQYNACGLLNTLHEENEQLKQVLKMEEEEAEAYNLDAMRYKALYEQQVDENEQLKQQLDEMITIFENRGLDYHISDELNEILNR